MIKSKACSKKSSVVQLTKTKKNQKPLPDMGSGLGQKNFNGQYQLMRSVRENNRFTTNYNVLTTTMNACILSRL